MATDPADRLREVWRVARAKRRPIATVVLLGTLVGALVSLILPPRWTASASFFPERRGQTDLTAGLGGLGGLAGFLGAAGGPLALGPTSSVFFADLIKSRTFLDSLAQTSVVVDSEGTVERVENYLVRRAKNAKLRRWKARQALQRAIRVKTMQSGTVVLSVTTKSPYASAALANRAIEVIVELNVAYRRREASARRRFTQDFLEDVQGRLTEAEDRLERFMTANRTVGTPALMRKQQTLQADADRLRMLKEQLESNIENARLSEYNNAPVVATVDQASVPERRSSPKRRLMVMGYFLATLVGVFWALYLGLWI